MENYEGSAQFKIIYSLFSENSHTCFNAHALKSIMLFTYGNCSDLLSLFYLINLV